MATSPALSTSNQFIKYTITVTQNSQNVANNTSNVTVSVRFYRTNTGYKTYNNGTIYCKIDGTQYSEKVTSLQEITEHGIVLFSKTLNITHNDNGAKSLTCAARIDLGSILTSSEQSYTQTLTTIARASQPSCITYPEHTQNVGNFGDTISIHMNRKSSSFTHTVRYAFGSRTGTIATGVTNGTTWTIPLNFMDLLPETISGSGTIYVDTYNGATLVGTKYCGFTATVPASVKPSCAITIADAATVAGTSGKTVTQVYGSPVKGLSKLKITVNPTLAYSSPIASYEITANGKRYTTAQATTNELLTAGATTITAKVTDKRNRSGSDTETVSALDYTAPNITALSVHRCNADGTENANGGYVKVTFSAIVSPLGNKNTAAYVFGYKKSADSEYESLMLTDLTNNFNVSNYTYKFQADIDNSYDIQVSIADRHNTVTRNTSASTAATLMNWSADGTAMGIGKVVEKSNALEVAWNSEFFGNIVRHGNKYTFSTPGIASTAGYILLAQIAITAANADTPISFVLTQRTRQTPMTVHMRFNNPTATTSTLSSIRYEGTNYNAFLVPEDDLTWSFYVQKASAYDTITIQDWWTSHTMESRIAVTFPGTLVSELPTPFHRATPAVLDSIIDCLMPVGYVLILYSHADPNTMYAGTTWERVQNAFLWGTDASGTIGQTGGAKTHTLTANELPNIHGSLQFRALADGTQALAALDPGNMLTYHPDGAPNTWSYGMSYESNANRVPDVVEFNFGAGAAHNNMPPYVQVSIWRRTA